MNQVELTGRLARDVEIKTVSGRSVAQFPLAVNRRYQHDGGPTADFFTVIVWGKTAEVIAKYFYKGKRIKVVGHLENRNYTDSQGIKRYVTEVFLEKFEFADNKTNTKECDVLQPMCNDQSESDHYVANQITADDEAAYAEIGPYFESEVIDE